MKKAGDILRGLLSDKQAAKAGEWSNFFSGWQKLAGTDIAAHSRVNDVERGVVIVEVDHPGWLQILQMKKAKILADMKRRYPELGIENMRIFVGNGIRNEGPDTGNKHPGSTSAGTDRSLKKRETETSPEYLRFKEMLERLRKVKDGR